MREIFSAFHAAISNGGRPVLSDITFSLSEREIVGLIPIDNQGFPEFLRMLVKCPILDKGHLSYMGREIASSMHASAVECKTAFIGRESGIIPALSIEDNFFTMRHHSPYIISQKKMRRAFVSVAKEYGLSLSSDGKGGMLSQKDRIKFEMIKAVELGYRIIVMIDIASIIGPKDGREIQALMRRLSEKGVSFLYISSHHEELIAFADRIMMMKNGSIIFIGKPEEYTDRLISALVGSYRMIPQRKGRKEERLCGYVHYSSFSIPFFSSCCLVILDLDNKVPDAFSEAVSGRNSGFSITVGGKRRSLYDRRVAFIPSDPQLQVFPDMSYLENMALRASDKIRFFWQRKGKFLKSIGDEFGNDDIINSPDLYGLSEDQLYELVYRRVELEGPDVVFILEPFRGLDLEGRMNVRRHIERLCNKKIAVVILAISLSDTLNVADRLLVLQDETVMLSAVPEEFGNLRDSLPLMR